MGKITSRPQKDINGKDSGLIDIEITYGGNEAPFGGIDSSAPPQYIDPHCFVDSSGFIISSKRLIACGFFSLGITLTGWGGNTFLGAGTFYTNGKYNNWCLGYTFARTPGPPAYNTVTYNIWVWNAGTNGNIPLTTSVSVIQYDSSSPAIAATASFGLYGPPNTATGTGTVYVNINGHQVSSLIVAGTTASAEAAQIAAAINADPIVSTLVNATSSSNVVTLTALTAGMVGNSYTLSVSTSGIGTIPYAAVLNQFTGGADATTGQQYGIPIIPLSWVAIGESLYFGGPGSMMLQYQNGILSVLTQYVGAVTLAKYGGFLIAGGVIPGPGTVIQASEMVIAWSANGAYGIWNPIDGSGNVTGAGFNQIADLSDYITGIFIMNSIAIVLHTQGIDYLTLTGSGLQPFDFNHISNSKAGEGCQAMQLNTQYDQIGFFVGNSDVFEYANGLQTIGAKIRQILLPQVQGATALGSLATQVPIDAITVDVFAFFLVGGNLYTFNRDDRTWMTHTFTNFGDRIGPYALTNFSKAATFGDFTQFVNQNVPTLVTLASSVPTFWEFDPYIQNLDFGYANTNSFVTFPSEEIDFGKDITIDSIYASLIGVNGQIVKYQVTGQLKGQSVIVAGQITLGAEADGVTVRHYKLYFTGTIVGPPPIPPTVTNTGTFVGKNPQLTISVDKTGTGVKSTFQIIKIKMFGSFDPTQIPT